MVFRWTLGHWGKLDGDGVSLQQLLDVISVIVKSVLLLSDLGPQDLCSGIVDKLPLSITRTKGNM